MEKIVFYLPKKPNTNISILNNAKNYECVNTIESICLKNIPNFLNEIKEYKIVKIYSSSFFNKSVKNFLDVNMTDDSKLHLHFLLKHKNKQTDKYICLIVWLKKDKKNQYSFQIMNADYLVLNNQFDQDNFNDIELDVDFEETWYDLTNINKKLFDEIVNNNCFKGVDTDKDKSWLWDTYQYVNPFYKFIKKTNDKPEMFIIETTNNNTKKYFFMDKTNDVKIDSNKQNFYITDGKNEETIKIEFNFINTNNKENNFEYHFKDLRTFIDNKLKDITTDIPKIEFDLKISQDAANNVQNKINNLKTEISKYKSSNQTKKTKISIDYEQKNNDLNKQIESYENYKQIINKLLTKQKKLEDDKHEWESTLLRFDELANKNTEITIVEIDNLNVIEDNEKIAWEEFKKDNNEDYFIKLDFNNFNSKYAFKSNWFISYRDIGFEVQFKRFAHSIHDLFYGWYKNPFLITELLETNASLNHQSVNFTVNDDLIIKKYNLNKNQKKFFEKFVNSNCLSFLQGPPGTGKTQLLSSCCEHEINNNNNVVISSNTHEAIRNLLDRLDDNNKTNPNIIFYKIAKVKENSGISNDDIKFSYNNIAKRFLEKSILKIKNKLLKNNVFEIINEVINKYSQNPKKPPFPTFLLKVISNKWKEKLFKLNDIKNIFENYIDDEGEYFKWTDSYITDLLYIPDEVISQLIEKYNISKELLDYDVEIIKIIEENWTIFKEILNVPFSYDGFLNNVKARFNKNQAKEINFDFLNELFKFSDNEKLSNYNDNSCKMFIDYVMENKLINIIACTTSSRLAIDDYILLNGKKINYNLFFEYPVSSIIIDEVSKSITPELLSRSLIATKVIFSGDYLQLPPSNNINDENMKLIYKKYQEYPSKNYKADLTKEEFEKEINKLWFSRSFFETKVHQIKGQSNEVYNYQNLNETHRFGDEICKFVNILYGDRNNENLISCKKKSKLINFDFNDKDYSKNNFLMLDYFNIIKYKNNLLTFGNNDFKKMIDCMTEANFACSSNSKPNYLRFCDEYLHSRYNEYSILIIANIVNSLIEQNKDNKDFKPSDISIICLTKSQEKLIKKSFHELKKNYKFFEYVKILTIDNFQGRENDVIIVDFVLTKKKYEHNSLTTIKNFNHISDDRRINVAISRAREKDILVGAFEQYININEEKNCNASLIAEIYKKYIKEY